MEREKGREMIRPSLLQILEGFSIEFESESRNFNNIYDALLVPELVGTLQTWWTVKAAGFVLMRIGVAGKDDCLRKLHILEGLFEKVTADDVVKINLGYCSVGNRIGKESYGET
ncbi:hypothetical protein MTR_5g071865 [Medicago truncatula]|uniref:Uncharacterized protein n=1 Tax=Medicago truncatula TaxID=3880 RepID=A0A072UEI4_MEDTR|nr:hypothetical protein MTR_5g071865 [Medicago truncatula]